MHQCIYEEAFDITNVAESLITEQRKDIQRSDGSKFNKYVYHLIFT